mgnify:CR=1 FL=1
MNREQIHEQYEEDEKLREECGVFGIYDFDGNDVASTIYYGLPCSTEDRRAAASLSAIRTAPKAW